MTTFADLITEVQNNLQGFTESPDQTTYITGSLDNVSTTVVVNDPTQVGRGIAEIDHELVYVQGVDPSTGTVTFAPYGRGYRGSTAATHSSGAMFTMSPTWPRHNIAMQVNNVITSLWPTVYSVASAPLWTADQFHYQTDLPDAAERVIDVRWWFSDTLGWQRAVQWELEHSTPVDTGLDNLTGTRYISIYDTLPVGSTLQVLYASRPVTLSNPTDDFTLVSGLPASCKDVVILGTAAWMAQFLDVARMATTSVAADALGQTRPLGSGTQIATALTRQFQARLATEAAALAIQYPPRFHKVR